MKYYRQIITAGLWLFILLLSGCDPIGPDPVTESETATINAMTTLEYSVYVGKEINVFTNQIMSQLGLISDEEEQTYENLSESIKESISLMQEAYDELFMTTAPETNQTEKEAILKDMHLAMEHMEQYLEAVQSEREVSGIRDRLQNDFYALTSVSVTYTQ